MKKNFKLLIIALIAIFYSSCNNTNNTDNNKSVFDFSIVNKEISNKNVEKYYDKEIRKIIENAKISDEEKKYIYENLNAIYELQKTYTDYIAKYAEDGRSDKVKEFQERLSKEDKKIKDWLEEIHYTYIRNNQ